MFRLWFGLAALFLAVSCSERSYLGYQIKARYPGFEERSYPATTWIQTKIEGSPNIPAVMAAVSTLKRYCQKLQNPDVCKMQPAVIYKYSSNQFFLQWFIPPGVFGLHYTDPKVRVRTIPSMTLYARGFVGSPSLENVEESVGFLKADLDKAHKHYNSWSYFGACYYDDCFQKEIWILAA